MRNRLLDSNPERAPLQRASHILRGTNPPKRKNRLTRFGDGLRERNLRHRRAFVGNHTEWSEDQNIGIGTSRDACLVVHRCGHEKACWALCAMLSYRVRALGKMHALRALLKPNRQTLVHEQRHTRRACMRDELACDRGERRIVQVLVAKLKRDATRGLTCRF